MHRQVQPGLVHHSDRGVQYASKQHTRPLLEHGIQISMGRSIDPMDSPCQNYLARAFGPGIF